MTRIITAFFSAPSSKITTYDILKTIAIVLMVIDHIGYYFYPLDMDFRAVGRLCVPIWLFLIGYARSRRVDGALIASAILLTVLNYIRLGEFNTVTILVTIMIVRLTLNPIMRRIGGSQNKLALFSLVCFVLAPLTRAYVEYGSIAYLLAIWGNMARNGFNGEKNFAPLYGAVAMAGFLFVETMSFSFSPGQTTFMVLGAVPVFWAMTSYLPGNDAIIQPRSRFIQKLLSWTGHHTLFLYVAHLTVFRLVWMAATCHGLFPCY